MTDSPKVSVVIPCYNQGVYVDEAVDSVFRQTCSDFEIIIVNDGSTDVETNALLRGYQRPRTTVVEMENRGLPAARNVGIQAAGGQYVCALDADDVLEASYFEKAVALLDQDPSIAFVSHWLDKFGVEEGSWTPQRCDLVALLDTNTVNGAAMVRREALIDIGLFDESMREGCEDWELWIRMVERGYRGVILPEVLFHYRRRVDSMSRAMTEESLRLRLWRTLIEKHDQSYRRHLLELLQRREVNLCDLRAEIFDLESEYEAWWGPEVRRRRDEVAFLRRKVESLRRREQEVEARRRLDEEVADLRARLSEARSEKSRIEEASTHLEADLEGHRSALRDLQAENEALRSSVSWRLAGPVRWLGRWFGAGRRGAGGV